jgi:hypothetical protein
MASSEKVCGDCTHLIDGYCYVHCHELGYSESACYDFDQKE